MRKLVVGAVVIFMLGCLVGGSIGVYAQYLVMRQTLSDYSEVYIARFAADLDTKQELAQRQMDLEQENAQLKVLVDLLRTSPVAMLAEARR